MGPKYRTIVANLSIALFYTAGTTILPWIAWGISDWRMFSLATAVPMASALTAYWIVPESARLVYFIFQHSTKCCTVYTAKMPLVLVKMRICASSKYNNR